MKTTKRTIRLVLTAIILLFNKISFAQISVTGGTTQQGYLLTSSAIYVDPSITITSSSSISGFRVTIASGFKSSDVLSYTGSLPSGVSATAYNSSTGVLAFTGSTMAANWLMLLRTVTFQNSNSAQYGDRVITFSAGTSSAFSNGHFYELVNSSTISWTAAKTAAEGRTYLGYTGYLATITSSAENAYIKQVLAADAWIGCSDDYSYINAATGTTTYANQTASEGRWTWVTGPEKGTLFSVGNTSPVTQSGQFAYWNSGEPNNSGGSENYGEIYSSGTGQWNDLPNTSSLGYVVEYGGLSTDPVQTLTSNVTISTLISSNTATAAQTICNGATPSAFTGSTPGGGNGTYTYSWISSTTSASSGFAVASGTNTSKNYSPSSLTSSTWYRRIVTSGSQTDTSAAIMITVDAALSATTSQNNVSCKYGSNGTATVVASGGTSAYAYTWSPSGGTGATATGLSAGSYSCLITDALTCTVTKNFTITEPIALTASTSQINIACNGATTGSATVTPSGGTSAYTYSWSPSGGTGASAISLAAGSYICTITDANSCQITKSFTLTQPSALVASTSQTNISCNGGINGSATVSVSGGTAAYTYAWSPSGGAGITATGLTAGNYSCTITDANACQLTKNFTLAQPTALTASTSQNNVSCNGGSNGTASVVASGGTSAYTYSWSPSGGTGATATGLAQGSYTCTIVDANSCQITKNFSITQPSTFTATKSQLNIPCNGGANGSATVNVSGGTSAYTYSWFPSGGTGATASSLAAGNYTCTIIDANSCQITKSFTLTQPSALVASTSQNNVSCNGGTNGSATVSVSGGTSSYTYAWSPSGGTGTTASGLASGNYSCVITDANSCQLTKNFTLTQPTALAAATSQINISCNGGSNGSATVSVSGGTSGYTYAWSPSGGTNATAADLASGNYSCTITDANTCQVTKNFTLTEPTALSANISQTDVSCNGGSNGSATVAASGGTSGYTYSWSSSSGTADTETGLSAGTYTCTITDTNLCSVVKTFTLTEPSALTATSSAGVILCHGDTATIVVSATGGTTPYSGDGQFREVAGSYNYTVTDSNGCSVSTGITIDEPSALTAASSAGVILCHGDTTTIVVTANGGTTPYSGDGQFREVAGSYNYTVTDSNGCLVSTGITINEPPALTAASSAGVILCHGDTTAIVVTANGGTTPYSGDGQFREVVGSYNYTVTDSNGCFVSTSIAIAEPPVLSVNTSAGNILCHADSATVIVTANGGTTPYSGEGIFTEAAGTYNYLVTDSNGCSARANVVIIEPAAIVLNQTLDICAGSSINLNGIIHDATGIYIDTLISSSGCDSTVITNLTVNDPIDTTTSIIGNGLSANAIGSTYQWVDCGNNSSLITGEVDQNYNPSTEGSYAVIITKNGCVDTSACTAFINMSVADLQDLKYDALNVYPNPNSGSFTITGKHNGVYTLSNAIGQVIQVIRLNSFNKYTMNIDGLSNGIYFISGAEENHIEKQKIIVTK